MVLSLVAALLTTPLQVQGDTSSKPPTVEAGHQKDIDNDEKDGAKFAAQVDKENKQTTDPKMQARVERIGKELGDIADSHQLVALWGDKRFSPFPYKFKVIQGTDVNAFSLPGGYVYVYEGLVKYCESDDELASVLGHEISHAAFRHVSTLTRKSGQFQLLTLPMILLGILAPGAVALIPAYSLLNQAVGSGWSVQAEEAADYGGFQIVHLSKYNPVGMLTFMERLARDEHMGPSIAWGIYRDHPPSFARAQSITRDLKALNIPIKRSEVATSYRAEVRPSADGLAVIVFNNQRIHGFAGDDAIKRADDAVIKLNDFFDRVPELYEAKIGPDGNIYGRNRLLITITDADVAAAKVSRTELAQKTLGAVRGALYTYGDRVWQGSV